MFCFSAPCHRFMCSFDGLFNFWGYHVFARIPTLPGTNQKRFKGWKYEFPTCGTWTLFFPGGLDLDLQVA